MNHTKVAILIFAGVYSFNSCAISENMMKSVGIGCLAGLAVGAIADQANLKASNEDKKKFQNKISGIFKQKKKEPQYKGKVVGLGVGCLAGLGVGFYLDQMAEDMEEQLKAAGMTVEKIQRDGETKELLIKAGENSMTFKPNSPELTKDSEPKVEKIADAVKGYSETKIRIAGHVSADVAKESDIVLSQNRADSIKEKLVSFGVNSGSIIESKGFSNTKPLPGTKPTDSKNRRVEIFVLAE